MEKSLEKALYLIPVTLGESDCDSVLPCYNRKVIEQLRYFIVENVRTARRFIKKVSPAFDIDAATFAELNEHTPLQQVAPLLRPLDEGHPVGVLSEAGCPAVADPGADVVALAQQRGYRVVPLVGPSSILLSLMGSGFNGQSFAFNGYLPVTPAERTKKLKSLEQRIYNEEQTQIFIETPYRNAKLLNEITAVCRPQTKLCIAANITCEGEYIVTRTVKEWRSHLPELGKVPCIFLLYK